MKTLILGGVRSGKSARAESLLSGVEAVTYVACGPSADDADWAARVRAHRERRPTGWSTIESTDPATVIGTVRGPVLLDCLGTWLTAQLDELSAWETPIEQWKPAIEARTEALCAAIDKAPCDLVIVSNEVGLTLVSEHRSGRIFTDGLGRLNQDVAARCDRVELVVAGLTLTIKDSCGGIAAAGELPP